MVGVGWVPDWAEAGMHMVAVCQMSEFHPVSASSPALPQTAVTQALDVPDMRGYPTATNCFSGHEMRGHTHTHHVTEENWGDGLVWGP